MKLLRVGPPGEERPCVLLGGVVRDVSEHVPDYDGAFFAAGGVADLHRLVEERADELQPVAGDVRIGAPIARPHHVLCIGLNYTDHAAESGMPVPTEPVVFTKAPNTVVGPDDDVYLPPGAEKVDWEVELGVVIGRTARYLPDEEAARGCVAGFVLCNDVSERHSQLERGGQWVKGKSFETFNPTGPWLVTPDEVADVQALDLELRVNGTVRQQGTTADMVFSVAHLVWYLSQFMVLEPGDVVNTGTPAGVGLGHDPPVYLAEGDVIELEISGLGSQRQRCRRAAV